MKLATLKKKGFRLVNKRVYKTQTITIDQYLIGLNAGTHPEGKRYYQAVDQDENIMLVREENLEL